MDGTEKSTDVDDDNQIRNSKQQSLKVSFSPKHRPMHVFFIKCDLFCINIALNWSPVFALVQDETFANASNVNKNTHGALSSWMEHGKITSSASIIEKHNMSESHGHFTMDGRTSARSRTLDSATGVSNGLGEDDDEEDTRNFVSTLDVDAIKV